MTPIIEQTLIILLPAFIGGLIAALGFILGALIMRRVGASREFRANERAKLERIATAAFEYTEWVEERRMALLSGRVPYNEPSPSNELRMLANLHFPSLCPELKEMLQAGHHCVNWVKTAASIQNEGLDSWLENPDKMNSYYPLHELLLARTDAFVDAVRRIMPK